MRTRQAPAQVGDGGVRRPCARAEPGHGQDTAHGIAQEDGVGAFDIRGSDARLARGAFGQHPRAAHAGDAAANAAWLLTPDTPMTILGVALSDVQLWLRPDHLGAYFVGTGSMAGISVTTSNTFLEWGGQIDISVPED